MSADGAAVTMAKLSTFHGEFPLSIAFDCGRRVTASSSVHHG
jgi:hypothetical protein